MPLMMSFCFSVHDTLTWGWGRAKSSSWHPLNCVMLQYSLQLMLIPALTKCCFKWKITLVLKKSSQKINSNIERNFYLLMFCIKPSFARNVFQDSWGVHENRISPGLYRLLTVRPRICGRSETQIRRQSPHCISEATFSLHKVPVPNRELKFNLCAKMGSALAPETWSQP